MARIDRFVYHDPWQMLPRISEKNKNCILEVLVEFICIACAQHRGFGEREGEVGFDLQTHISFSNIHIGHYDAYNKAQTKSVDKCMKIYDNRKKVLTNVNLNKS